MKISKTALLALSGALSIAGLGLMFVSAEKNVILNIDPSNAVQHIETVKFISGSTDGTATLQQVGNSLVGIDTNNFALSKEGGDQNTNNGNLGSSILGGIKNTLVGSYNVILGGEGNNINDGMNNVILGGNGNTIKGGKNYSTIVGGKGNTINESIGSVIVGGWKNDIAKKTTNDGYSVVVGSNSSVKGNNSTALGVESKVDANNSFLWTDRDHNGTLSADGAFAVVGRNGMVIGTNQAHSFAQLTLNGGLVIRKGDSNLECNHSNGGSLRVVDAPSGDGRVCLCSCDGYSWNSMFGLGQCKLACDSRYNPPVCGTKVVKICGDGDMNIYSGSCEKGEVVEGDGAYLVTKDNMVHWSCQTDDALVVNCVGVALDEGCNVHGVARPCKGTRPGEGQMYKFGDGGYLHGHTPSRWTRVEDTKELEACEWRCNSESGYLWNGTMCVLTSYDCGGVKPTGNGYIFGETRYLYGTTPNTWGYTGSLTPGQCQYTCDTNYTWNGSSCVANACQGTLPDHATLWNNVLPSNNTTNYSYSATTTTAACKFKCDTNYTWNATTKMCVANERLGDCTGLPTYAEWVNGKFKQTWNGTSWTPATKIAVFSTDSSVECSFKCKTNYTYNTISKTCVANTQQKNCTGKPDNSYWVNDKFKQTWNGSAWTPATKAATYSSSSSVECSFQCNENYTWNSTTQTCVANGHLGDCTGLPAHAEWVNGKFQQTWNGSAWTPATKAATFSTDGSVECSFKCKTNYTYNTTSKACVANTQQKSCTGKPDNSYWVNDKFQQTWNGSAWMPATKAATYSSNSSVECSFQCNQNYTWDSTTQTCVANGGVGDCTGLPAHAEWVNGKFQQTWNGSVWVPTTKTATFSTDSSVECSFKCKTNYTYNTTSKACVADTQQKSCTGKPDNSYWVNDKFQQTWDGSVWTPATKAATYSSNSSVECSFQCNQNYTWDSTTQTCVANGHLGDCTGLPAHAEWVNGKFQQTWNGSVWVPTTKTATFSTDGSVECSFKCKTHYTYNTTSKACVADTQQKSCTGKPDNSYWVNDKFQQTWDGTSWKPATKDATYSSSSSVECSFQCNQNYTYNTTSKTCEANTQQKNCTGKPDNSYWVNGKFQQTWNGSVWTPATKAATYSSSSSVECSFQCNDNYTWNSTTQTCVANGHLGDCTGLPAHAEWVNGKFQQTWNGSVWVPTTKTATFSTDSSVECSFKCKTNYTYNTTSKACVADTQQKSCTGKPDNSYWVNDKFQQTWDGSVWTPATKAATYSSNSSVECSFQCNQNYTWDSTTQTCVANGHLGDCTGLPAHAEWVNGKFQQTWNGSVWVPTTKTATFSTDGSVECSFKCKTNYTYNTTSKACVADTQQKSCTGKPDNSYWVNDKFQQTWDGTSWKPATKDATYSSSSSVECSFQCNQNYTYNTTSKTCEANTQQKNCTGKPDNSYWVNGKFQQTWNGSVWTPATKDATYSSSSSVECSFQCNQNYTYNTTSKTCEANTQQKNCTGKPDNSYWVNGKFQQTWNGSVWTPATKAATYSSSSSVECSFQCNQNYTWNGSDCVPAQKLTVRFYANGNKIPVAQNAYEEDYIERECVVGSNGTCDITSPSITAATNTPTVIGWSTVADRHESDWAPGATKTISSNGKYYAQTKKDGKTLNATFESNGNRFLVSNSYTTDDIVKNCTIPTVYNGSTQATSCNVTSPTIAGLTDSRVIIGFSSSKNSHTNGWSPNTSKAISSDETYYAQTKKEAQVKVTFRANGNKVQNDQGVFVSDDVIKTCSRGMYYNGSTTLGSLNPTCSITSPYITATTSTPTVIGWSKAADRHEKDWTVGASLGLSASHVEYFAQTEETKTLKIKLEKDDTVSSISESGEKTLCTVNRYNNGGDRTPSTCSTTFPTCNVNVCYENCKFYAVGNSYSYAPGGSFSFRTWDNASNVPVYTARATIKKFTITYNPNGGKWSDGSISNKISNDVNCGNITLEAAPTKDGYNFQGWYTDSIGGTKVGDGGSSYSIAENTTLYAHWSAISYSCGISVNSCGGSVTATNSDENDSKWRWYCGTKYCYKCKGGYNDQGGGVCSEPTEDGECNFDNGKCSAGTYEYLNNIGDGTSDVKGIKWRCNGKGNGQSHTCTLRWNCNGSCSADTSDCAGMYVGTNAPKTRTDCYNAGMYVLYKRNGAYGVATSEIYNKDTCYLSSPVAGYESDNSCGEESSNYINNPNAIFGYSRSCMKWTPTVKCEQLVDSGSPTSVSTTKCDNVLSSKPMTCTSTSSWGGPGGNSNVGGAKCYYKAGTSHARGCAAVYPNGTTPYNGTNWISGSDNTAGWISYCSNQKSQTACEAVKVASFCAANCGSSGSPVHQYNLPGSNGPANVIISDCCEWR